MDDEQYRKMVRKAAWDLGFWAAFAVEAKEPYTMEEVLKVEVEAVINGEVKRFTYHGR